MLHSIPGEDRLIIKIANDWPHPKAKQSGLALKL
jgi:hypothetical protein